VGVLVFTVLGEQGDEGGRHLGGDRKGRSPRNGSNHRRKKKMETSYERKMRRRDGKGGVGGGVWE